MDTLGSNAFYILPFSNLCLKDVSRTAFGIGVLRWMRNTSCTQRAYSLVEYKDKINLENQVNGYCDRIEWVCEEGVQRTFPSQLHTLTLQGNKLLFLKNQILHSRCRTAHPAHWLCSLLCHKIWNSCAMKT